MDAQVVVPLFVRCLIWDLHVSRKVERTLLTRVPSLIVSVVPSRFYL